MSTAQRIAAEALGTALLLAIVVGSGIMAERLAGGNVALELLANAVATGAGRERFRAAALERIAGYSYAQTTAGLMAALASL